MGNRPLVLAVLVLLGALWLLLLVGQIFLLGTGFDHGVRAETVALAVILGVVTWVALGYVIRRAEGVGGLAVQVGPIRSAIAWTLLVALAGASAAFLARPREIWQRDVDQVKQVAASFLIERQIRDAPAMPGVERRKLYLGRDLSEGVLRHLRKSFPGIEITRLEDVPPERISPGDVLPMGWNPAEIDRVTVVNDPEFPLWRVVTLHYSVSACGGAITLMKFASTWRVVAANIDYCI